MLLVHYYSKTSPHESKIKRRHPQPTTSFRIWLRNYIKSKKPPEYVHWYFDVTHHACHIQRFVLDDATLRWISNFLLHSTSFLLVIASYIILVIWNVFGTRQLYQSVYIVFVEKCSNKILGGIQMLDFSWWKWNFLLKKC